MRVPSGGACLFLAVAIDHDFVQAEVSDESELLVCIEIDRVGVRFFLAGLVHAGAAVLNEGNRFVGEFAFGIDGIDDDVAAGVVGGEDMLAGFVDDDVAGVRAFGGGFVDFGEFGGIGWIDFEAGDRAVFFAAVVVEFVDGVEKFAVGMNGEERGAGRFGGEADLFEGAGGGVEFVGVDAFAGPAGVGADVNGEFLRCGCRHSERKNCGAEKFQESHGAMKQRPRAAGKEGSWRRDWTG